AGAAGVIDSDDRNSIAQRQLLHFDDLFGRDLSERAAEDRGVVGIRRDRAPIDLAEAGHHPVARDPPILHAEAVRAMSRKQIELDERALVEHHLDAVASRGLPAARRLLAASVSACSAW